MSTREQDAESLSGGLEGRSHDGEIQGLVDSEPSANEQVDTNESASESLERFLGDAVKTETDELPGNKDPEIPNAEGKDNPAPAEVAEKPGKQQEQTDDPELRAPERFSEAAKRAFSNAPKGVRREIHRAIKDLEGMASRATQEARAEVRKWQPLEEAVGPLAARWARHGVGLVPGVLQLAACQERLTNKDYGVRETEIESLCDSSKVDIIKLALKRAKQSDADPETIATLERASHSNENSHFSNELQTLKSQLEEERLARETAPYVSEMERVRSEKDPASGRFVRPALQDEAFLESVKPLVLEELRNAPGIGHGEALKRAHDRKWQQMTGEPWRASQTRIPASNSTNAQRALSAGMSVRGRTAPVTSAIDPEVPTDVGNGARESLEWFMTRGGRI